MALPGRILAADIRAIVRVARTVDDAGLAPYIDAANELVTEVCASVFRADGVTLFYDSHRLLLIEQWLSSHLYCIFDPRAERERVSVLTFEAQSKVGLCLDVTHYGQQAKLLDTNGGLALLDAKAKIDKVPIHVVMGVTWGGTPYDE